MDSKYLKIAIDGPSGSGKSTIASKLSKILPDFIHINTGSMYRALSYFFIVNNIDYNDQEKRKELLNKIEIFFDKEKILVRNNNEIYDVTNKINNEEIAFITSMISQFPDVRECLIKIQRKIAENNNVIMDGRDIGTVVLPDATLKIFLTASVDTRAQRRYNQLLNNTNSSNISLQEIKEQISIRDKNDINRKIGGLIQADDAYLIQTDNLTINDCCELILNKLELLIN